MKPTAIRAGTGAVHALLAAVAVVLGALSVRAAQFELQRPIAELRLKDGTVLHDVTFVSVGASSITGKWNGGRGSIPLVQLPDEVRAALVPAAAVKPAVAPLATPTPAPAPDGPGDTALLVPLPTEIDRAVGRIIEDRLKIPPAIQATLVAGTFAGEAGLTCRLRSFGLVLTGNTSIGDRQCWAGAQKHRRQYPLHLTIFHWTTPLV